MAFAALFRIAASMDDEGKLKMIKPLLLFYVSKAPFEMRDFCFG